MIDRFNWQFALVFIKLRNYSSSSYSKLVMKRYIILLLCLLSSTTGLVADNMINIYDRDGISLNGRWQYIVDPYENGFYNYRQDPFDASDPITGGYMLDAKQKDKTELLEYDFDLSPSLNVPGDWNSQDEKLYYYEGSVWYRRKFTYKSKQEGSRQFVYFGGANYKAHVYLNGKKLGQHVGGFTPFSFEATNILNEGENSLVVMVNNNRHKDAVPTVNTDWWNFGGLTRDVMLVEVPQTFITDYTVALTDERIRFSAQLEGGDKSQEVTLRIPELGVDVSGKADRRGAVDFEISIPSGLERWSPENPKLYDVSVVSETDSTSERIGFRTIVTEGPDILLNGESIFLRGISIHEENSMRGGRAFSKEDAALLLGWAKELGCNFVRLAHYPHNEHMARLADEMGILVWEEIPVYWTISWENEETLANAQNQLSEVIMRDRNRASVIVWSMANETPISEPRTRFLKTLVDQTRRMDPTRLVSAAMELHAPVDPAAKIVDDPFGEYTDIIAFNQYVGWYDGLPEKCDRTTFDVQYNKPVVISEFGAGALQGWEGDELTRFSEAFQKDLYERSLKMLEKIPNFRGVTPWVLVDFHSPRRHLPGIQDGWNRKGLIGDNGEKKSAFWVLKEFYDKKAEEE